MNSTPEIDAVLGDLTEVCCDALMPERSLDHVRVQELAKSLSTNGWERHSENEAPLSTILKNRVREHCKEPAIHRGAEIDGIVSTIQSAYDDASRMQASSPNGNRDQPLPPRTTA